MAGVVAVLLAPTVKRILSDLTLPLSYESVIRQEAQNEHLNPALVAAVIYAETKFDPRTSPTGALGLMQIEPATAEFLAQRSGATCVQPRRPRASDDQHRLRLLLPALPAEPLPAQ